MGDKHVNLDSKVKDTKAKFYHGDVEDITKDGRKQIKKQRNKAKQEKEEAKNRSEAKK